MNTDIINFDIDFSGLKPQGVALVFPETEIHTPFTLPPKHRICEIPSTKNGFTVELDMKMQDYLQMTQLSSGAINTQFYGGCSLELQHYLSSENPPTKAMSKGIAVHSFIEAFVGGVSLDGFMSNYYLLPKTNRAKKDTTIAEIGAYCDVLGTPFDSSDVSHLSMVELKERADELKEMAASSMVTESDYETLKGTYGELLRRGGGLWWLHEMISEATIYNNYLRCRPDGLLFYTNENDELCAIVVSVKTTADVSRAGFSAKGYLPKEAHYRYVISRAFGIELTNVTTLFLFLGTVAPYLSREVVVTNDTAKRYNDMYAEAMPKAVDAIINKTFKGYEVDGVLEI